LSHELRTPLTAIVGWSTMIKSGNISPERARAGMESIERNARAQTRLIDDLLDLSRIGTGKLSLEWAECEIRQVCEAAVDSVRPAAHQKQIAIRLTSGGDAGTVVVCDSSRLQQAFTNVISNAVKFTDKGGRVEVRLEAGAETVRVVVRDNGIGI